jgi:hypothetical protein
MIYGMIYGAGLALPWAALMVELLVKYPGRLPGEPRL